MRPASPLKKYLPNTEESVQRFDKFNEDMSYYELLSLANSYIKILMR